MENLTGAELYFYELAKSLTSLGHEVLVVSSTTISDFFINLSKESGFSIVSLETFTGNFEADLFIISHARFSLEKLSSIYDLSSQKIINVIHSELYVYHEEPLLSLNVYRYVAIRQEIKNYLNKNFGIPLDKIEVIYNPIDTTRFNLENTEEKSFGLFVGTYMAFRNQAVQRFASHCNDRKIPSVFIGQNYQFVKGYDQCLEPVWDVEKWIKKSAVCGGIIKGRTYWEAKLCGKPVCEYIVNIHGQVIDFLYEPKVKAENYDALKNSLDSNEVARKILSL